MVVDDDDDDDDDDVFLNTGTHFCVPVVVADFDVSDFIEHVVLVVE